jgi:hypothetical protein
MRSRIIAAFAVVGVLFGGSALLPASAAQIPEATPTAPANSVTSKSIKDGAVSQTDMLPAVNQVYLNTYNNTVGFPALKPEVAATLDIGKAFVVKDFAAVTVANIGGPFKTNKTKVGEFTLPAGTWRIDQTAFFARTIAGVAGTRPQLALRVGASATEFGTDFGTILGAEISPSAGRELSGTTMKFVTVAAPTLVEVFAFGYNDNGGAAGGGEITAAAQVGAVKVG